MNGRWLVRLFSPSYPAGQSVGTSGAEDETTKPVMQHELGCSSACAPVSAWHRERDSTPPPFPAFAGGKQLIFFRRRSHLSDLISARATITRTWSPESLRFISRLHTRLRRRGMRAGGDRLIFGRCLRAIGPMMRHSLAQYVRSAR